MSAPDGSPSYGQPQFGAYGPYDGGPQWPPPTPAPTPAKKRSGLPRWVIPVGVGVVALFIGVGIGGAGGSTAEAGKPPAAAKPGATVTATATTSVTATVTATPPAPTATVTTTFTPVPVTAFNDGLLVIGTDVQPGRYRTDGSGGTCYWARLSSLNTTDIISNNLSSGPQTIEVQPGDVALSTTGGCDWSKVG